MPIKKGQKYPINLDKGVLPDSVIRDIPTDEVLVDSDYQRALDPRRVTFMARHWNPDLLGVIVVNQRANSGKYYVVDGQHRHAALQLLPNWPSHITAEVFSALTPAQEADLFHQLDTKRRSLRPFDAFRARLMAGDPVAVGINNSVRLTPMRLGTQAGLRIVRCMTAVETVYERYGGSNLSTVMNILAAAWPTEETPAPSQIVLGLGALLHDEPSVDHGRLALQLAGQTPQMIVARARAMTNSLSANSIEVMVNLLISLYNSGLRTRRIGAADKEPMRR